MAFFTSARGLVSELTRSARPAWQPNTSFRAVTVLVPTIDPMTTFR